MKRNFTLFSLITIIAIISIITNIFTLKENKRYENYLNEKNLYPMIQDIGNGNMYSISIIERIVKKKEISKREIELLEGNYNDKFFNGYLQSFDLAVKVGNQCLDIENNNIYYNISLFINRYYRNFKNKDIDKIKINEDEIVIFDKILKLMRDDSEILKKHIRKYSIIEVGYYEEFKNGEVILQSYERFKDGYTRMPESWVNDYKITKKSWLKLILEIHELNYKIKYNTLFVNINP